MRCTQDADESNRIELCSRQEAEASEDENRKLCVYFERMHTIAVSTVLLSGARRGCCCLANSRRNEKKKQKLHQHNSSAMFCDHLIESQRKDFCLRFLLLLRKAIFSPRKGWEMLSSSSKEFILHHTNDDDTMHFRSLFLAGVLSVHCEQYRVGQQTVIRAACGVRRAYFVRCSI